MTSPQFCCDPQAMADRFTIESVSRWKDAQLDLPDELKQKASFRPDDKVSVISCHNEDQELCCVILRKE